VRTLAARHRRDGLASPALLHQIRAAMFRAGTSRPRHKDAGDPTGGPSSNGHHRDWISAGEAVSLLGLSRRHVQRLAADPRGGLGGVRVGRTWALKRSLVLALARGKAAK
jgi:excisionase family DNA binding protein